MEIAPEDLNAIVEIQVKQASALGAAKNAENKAKMAEFYSDPAKIAAEEVEAKETFDAADTNKDGLLDLAEWTDFIKKSEANGVAKGWHSEPTSDEDMKILYEAHCRIGKNDAGVSFEVIMGSYEQVFAEVEKRLA